MGLIRNQFSQIGSKTNLYRKCDELGLSQDVNGSSAVVRSPKGKQKGSGFYCTPNGLFITNSHVLTKGPREKDGIAQKQIDRLKRRGIKFKAINNHRSQDLQLLHADPDEDIALLAPANKSTDFDYYSISSNTPKPEDGIHLIGQPQDTDLKSDLFLSNGKIIDGDGAYKHIMNNLGGKPPEELPFDPLDKEFEFAEDLKANIAIVTADGDLLGTYRSEPGTSGGVLLSDDGEVLGVNKGLLPHPEDWILWGSQWHDFVHSRPGIGTSSKGLLDLLDQWGYRTNDFLDGNEVEYDIK